MLRFDFDSTAIRRRTSVESQSNKVEQPSNRSQIVVVTNALNNNYSYNIIYSVVIDTLNLCKCDRGVHPISSSRDTHEEFKLGDLKRFW